MAEGDVPLVTSFGGSEIEFGGNGTKMTKANSRFVIFFFLFGNLLYRRVLFVESRFFHFLLTFNRVYLFLYMFIQRKQEP